MTFFCCLPVSTPNFPDLHYRCQSHPMESNQKASGDALVGTPKEAALRTLMQRTGYQLRQVRGTGHDLLVDKKHFFTATKCFPCSLVCVLQENGQRRYGGPPPGWDGPPPERGSEIFVGKLPRDLFEDELVPLCEKVRDYWFEDPLINLEGPNLESDSPQTLCPPLWNLMFFRPGLHQTLL